MNAKATVSKELHTKHTKILEGLLKLPINKQCADCKSIGPRWASINLGVFICLQCSGIHRSLGVHISQVRSATLDTWLPEQVAFMQKMGNEKANNYWEAELPPNYAKRGIESFIHSKYKEKRWVPRDERSTPPSKVEEEVSFQNNLGNLAAVRSSRIKKDDHAPKTPTSAPSKVEPSAKEPRRSASKESNAKVTRSRNKSAGSTSSSKASTQKTTDMGAPSYHMNFFDNSITSASPLSSHQQQVQPPHHQDRPEPVLRVLTHQRSMSDSHAMNGTITTQSWVNFDYDDPEDSPQQTENFGLPYLGASYDSFPAFSPHTFESYVCE